MANRFDEDTADNDGALASLVPSSYMKTEEFDPKGKVFTIAGFRVDEIKNSDEPAKKCNVLVLKDEDRGFILKKTTVSELAEVLGVDLSDPKGKGKCIGKQVEIYRGKTEYQGKRVDCMRLRQPANREPGSEV